MASGATFSDSRALLIAATSSVTQLPEIEAEVHEPSTFGCGATFCGTMCAAASRARRARAERRLVQRGDEVDPSRLEAESARLAERDRLDANRTDAPLKPASDARILDTTTMTFDGQVAKIVEWARQSGFGR